MLTDVTDITYTRWICDTCDGWTKHTENGFLIQLSLFEGF